MRRNLPLSVLLLVATSSCQINRLHHFHVKDPAVEITVTTNLGGDDLPLRFPPPVTIRYWEMQRGEIQVNEIRIGESIPRPLDFPQSVSVRSVKAVATLISGEIKNEFGLGFRPGFVITLIHHAPHKQVILSGTIPIAQGSFAGVPLENGCVSPDALGILVTALAHEYSELLLASPDTLHCSLYANTQSNRWAGEGIAEFVTSLCELKIQETGFEINPIEKLLVPITISSATANPFLRFSWRPMGMLLSESRDPAFSPATINLSRWTFDSPHDTAAAEGVAEQGLRYLAAEYVVSLWYYGAQSQGMAQPIAELAKWIGYRSPGPSQQSLIRWMEDTSGVDISNLVQAAPTKEVLEYHRFKQELSW